MACGASIRIMASTERGPIGRENSITRARFLPVG